MRARVRRATVIIAVAASVSFWAASARAQQASPPPAPAAESAEELAKKLANPIANLVSVPFQFNWAQGTGPGNDTRFILNVQPVMPFAMSDDWNMILRVIMPFVGQPALVPGGTAASGLGDVLASAFFSPNKGGLIWGVGPVISLPSTSEPTLGSGKWSAGPTFVLLKQQGGWTYGMLANQLWSFSGSPDRREVSQAFFQPFVSYTTKKAVTIGLTSETTANWKAEHDQWTVPINLQVAKLSKFGVFPASYYLGGGVYVAGPDGSPEWQLRAGLTILLPKK